MQLMEGKSGETYTITNIDVNEASKHRLEMLGLVNGTSVQILTRKKGSAMVIKVRGTRFAIGKEFACGIFVNSKEADK